METLEDLRRLLNEIKEDEFGDKAYPFSERQLKYYINPKRNKQSYRQFTIPKKSGGVRAISAPIRILKSLQLCTNRILQAFYEAPDYVTGFVPARSVVDNAERHLGMNYVFNTDLKDFFPSISKSRVWATLKTRPFSFNDTIADAIAGLCCTELELDGETRVALPQGSPCSPVLTNIVCHNLDWKLNGLARRFHLRYSRYADDITFSSNHNVYQPEGEFMIELRRIVNDQRLTINEKKMRVQKKGQRQEVTGLVVSDRVNVTREYVRSLDSLLFIWEKHGEDVAFSNFLKHYVPKHNRRFRSPDMSKVILGKLMYLKMVKGEDSPVWQRLQVCYENLAHREPAASSDIQYLHSFAIDVFEKGSGVQLTFSMTDGKLKCLMEYKGREIRVCLSQYVQKRLAPIVESNNLEALEKLKKQLHIGYCMASLLETSVVNHFWLLYRKRPVVKDLPITLTEEKEIQSHIERYLKESAGVRKASDRNINAGESMKESVSVTSEIGTEEKKVKAESEADSKTGKTIDEVLDVLVSKNFRDLSILDKWDKIKTN